MGNPQFHDSSTPTRMSVNVALCGGIPRSCFIDRSGAPCGLQALSTHNISGGFGSLHHYRNQEEGNLHCETDVNRNMESRPLISDRLPLAQLCEAPSWAVPAKGETRLEPVCEGAGRQAPVDLTQKALYRVGRSPVCDIQLLHGTSSRRHAMIFHHSNGSCYLVDCGSAHGTFVNGVRISSPSNGGVVVPHKVRRGAMIRFGGPGAPCFVLKSFSFKLDDVFLRGSEQEPDMGELVRRNTRLNALGSSTAERVRGIDKILLFDEFQVSRKRSFDSLSTSATLDEDFEPICKRPRCLSPPMWPECTPLRLISPDLAKRHVQFSVDPPQEFHSLHISPEQDQTDEDAGFIA